MWKEVTHQRLNGENYVSCLFLPFTKRPREKLQTPSSGESPPPPVQTASFLCTEMLTHVVDSAQIAAMSVASRHVSVSLITIRCYFPRRNYPFTMELRLL